jgi:ABC-type Mn2+/Zn2+ transport system permease subunit
MVFGLLTAVLAEGLASLGNVSEDASLGVVFTALFALGVVLVSRFLRQVDLDPSCVFLGLLEGVPIRTAPWFGVEIPEALPTILANFLLTLGFLTLMWKELKVVAFDPALARAMGIAPALVNYLFIALVAGSTVTGFEALGSVLVVAMLVVPPATAHLLTDRLPPMLLWSALVAFNCAWLGYLLATVGPYPTNVPGMMAVVAGGQFALAVLFAPRHGLVPRMGRQLALSVRIAGEEILATLYRAEEAGTAAYILGLKEHGLPPGVVRLAYWNLRRLGLVTPREGLAALTDKGRRVAQSIIRSHRLWEAYAGQVMELPADHLHGPASRMEHYIGPELQRELADALHEPPIDPHGRSIPPGS